MSNHQDEMLEEMRRFSRPDYPGSQYTEWTEGAQKTLDESALCCEVCGAVPDTSGERQHGRGCYTLNEDGGGSDYFSADEMLRAFKGIQ